MENILNKTENEVSTKTEKALENVLNKTESEAPAKTEQALENILNKTESEAPAKTEHALENVLNKTESEAPAKTEQALENVQNKTESEAPAKTEHALENVQNKTESEAPAKTEHALENVLNKTESHSSVKTNQVVETIRVENGENAVNELKKAGYKFKKGVLKKDNELYTGTLNIQYKGKDNRNIKLVMEYKDGQIKKAVKYDGDIASSKKEYFHKKGDFSPSKVWHPSSKNYIFFKEIGPNAIINHTSKAKITTKLGTDNIIEIAFGPAEKIYCKGGKKSFERRSDSTLISYHTDGKTPHIIYTPKNQTIQVFDEYGNSQEICSNNLFNEEKFNEFYSSLQKKENAFIEEFSEHPPKTQTVQDFSEYEPPQEIYNNNSYDTNSYDTNLYGTNLYEEMFNGFSWGFPKTGTQFNEELSEYFPENQMAQFFNNKYLNPQDI